MTVCAVILHRPWRGLLRSRGLECSFISPIDGATAISDPSPSQFEELGNGGP